MTTPDTTAPRGLIQRIEDFFGAFLDLLHLPRAFWVLVIAFMINSMPYFGMLTLMIVYFTDYLKLHDRSASIIVSVFTAFVTLFMLIVGGMAERLGVRRGLLLAIGLCLTGRIAFSSVSLTGWTLFPSVALLIAALILIALGEAIQQPLTYSGVKQYTDEKTNSMGYGLIYALMNLGIFVIGLISPYIRVPLDHAAGDVANGTLAADSLTARAARLFGGGVPGVNWFCTSLSVAGLLFLFAFLTRRAEAERLRPEDEAKRAAEREAAAEKPLFDRVTDYFVEGPFSNARFVFFIFMLLPVQTLFAHQWLTMPAYVLRAYSQGVADRMEWIVNWINPGIIFFGVPIATAMTRRVNVYTMMIIGSAVSAIPTFLLCSGPNLWLLISYLVLFSIGEALWQPRFLQYAAELAPEGKVSQYMGLANVPWITVKMTTGLYSGYMLDRYCPKPGEGVQDTVTMWFIYGIIAMLSPIGLIIGRRWVMRGLHAPRPAPANG